MWFKDNKQGAVPTYQIVHNIAQSYLLDHDHGKSSWEFLMIEVKHAQGMRFTHGLY